MSQEAHRCTSHTTVHSGHEYSGSNVSLRLRAPCHLQEGARNYGHKILFGFFRLIPRQELFYLIDGVILNSIKDISKPGKRLHTIDLAGTQE